MAIDKIIYVVPVRHGFVSTSGSVDMPGLVPATVRGASIGIFRADFKPVLVNMSRMRMVQVPVMQEIDMPVVPDRGMAAVRAVPVGMVGMVLQRASGHA